MFYVTEVVNINKNHHLFRQVSHESAGEGFQPPDGDRVFLGYETLNREKTLVAAASYTRADSRLS